MKKLKINYKWSCFTIKKNIYSLKVPAVEGEPPVPDVSGGGGGWVCDEPNPRSMPLQFPSTVPASYTFNLLWLKDIWLNNCSSH